SSVPATKRAPSLRSNLRSFCPVAFTAAETSARVSRRLFARGDGLCLGLGPSGLGLCSCCLGSRLGLPDLLGGLLDLRLRLGRERLPLRLRGLCSLVERAAVPVAALADAGLLADAAAQVVELRA